MKKFVLFQTSGTQRVTVLIQDDESVLVSKEWKKNKNDTEWIVGKGITFPQSKLRDLGDILNCKSSSELNKLLKEHEVVELEEESYE